MSYGFYVGGPGGAVFEDFGEKLFGFLAGGLVLLSWLLVLPKAGEISGLEAPDSGELTWPGSSGILDRA